MPEQTIEEDPIWHLMPADQIDAVLDQDECDIDPSFLGFTSIYQALSAIIPKHWNVIDLGCAFAPQAMLFREHRAYIGVDAGDHKRFSAPNTVHYTMTTGEFLQAHGADFDKSQTFAICSYVPPWYREDSIALTRHYFENVFTFYPAGTPRTGIMFAAAKGLVNA